MSAEYYDILGLRPGATLSEVKQAYRRLAQQYHPDHNHANPSSAEKFRRITEAYRHLRDLLRDTANGHRSDDGNQQRSTSQERQRSQTTSPPTSQDLETLLAYCNQQEARVGKWIDRLSTLSSPGDRLYDEFGVWSNFQLKLPYITSHPWHYPDNEQNAYHTVRRALNTLRKNRPEIIRYLLNTLLGLYDTDRATYAAALLHAGKPIQRADIPDVPPGKQANTRTPSGLVIPTSLTAIRHIESLTDWQATHPASVTHAINTLIDEEIPDRLRLVTWEQESGSIIYAQYGDWYIKLAEWQ